MPYIGNQHNVGDHVNNFKVLDDISSYTATFDGSATSVVSTSAETIRIPEHRFIQGQRVTYNNGGGSNIGGLISGTAYYVSFDSANTIKLATSLSNANSNTVINLSTVGGGTSHTLNAAFDGINTKFKLTFGSGNSARLNNATQINVAINNVIQRPNLDANNFADGFALADNHKIVFKTAPTSQDIFWGSIISNTIENFDLRDNEVDNFTGNGSATEFNLSTIPANNESVIVTIDGVLQHPSDKNTSRAYTLLSNIIQFTAAPALNAEIQVRHIGFAGASTNDVSGFYGRTGNVTLTANDHITTGDITSRNINASGIITAASANFGGNVSIGGTLTYEDVANIDSVGIITARSNIDCNGDLDVDGHTNLDNVSVAGFSTFNDRLHISNTAPVLKFTETDNSKDFFIVGDSNKLSIRKNNTAGGSVVQEWMDNSVLFRENVDIDADIDVDGHTNLDNVSIAGVTTTSDMIKIISNRNALSAPSVAGNYHLHITNPQNDAGETVGISFGLSTGGDIGAAITHEREGSNSVGNLRFYTKENSNPASMLERMRISKEGKVGIGTNNPDELLELGGTNPVLKLHDSAGGSTHGLRVNHDGVNATINLESAGLLSIKQTNGNAADNGIAFNTGTVDTEKLRITGDGKVGIGTNNPESPLVVRNADNTLGIFTSTDSGANIDIFDDDTQSRIRSVDGRLHLYADFNNAVGSGAVADSSIRFFVDGNNEKLRITSAGNVGINSENPSNALSIVSGSNLGISLINNTDFATAGIYLEGGRNAGTGIVGELQFYNRRNSGVTSKLKVNGDGDFNFEGSNTNSKVGINSISPEKQLVVRTGSGSDSGILVKPNINYAANQDRAYLIVGTDDWGTGTSWKLTGFQHRIKSNSTGVSRVTIDTSGGEAFCVENGGNVGIGTNDPVRPLHIHAADCRIRLEDAGVATDVELQNSSGDAVLTTNGASNVRLQTNNTERLRITSGGHVNIAPNNLDQTAYKVQIETGANRFLSIKTANHNDFSDEGSGIFFSRQSDGSKELSGIFAHTNTSLGMASRGNLTFHAGGSGGYNQSPERLRIDANGLMGLGVTPTSHVNTTAFHIHDDYNSAGVPRIRLTNESTGSTSADGYEIVLNGTDMDAVHRQRENADIYFMTNNSERFRITADGDLHTGNGVRDDARLTIEKNKVGVSTAIHIHNSNGSGTASKISSSKGLILSADVEDNTGTDRSFISLHVDNSEKLRIDSNGYVTKPNNAMFKAMRTSNQSVSSSGWHTIQFNTDTATGCFDVGSNFNTSNHRFTAPVTGYYQFGLNMRIDGGNGDYFRVAFSVDGDVKASDNYPYGHAIYKDTDGFSYYSFSITALNYLTAGQYVRAEAYSSNDTSWTLQDESIFYGYLVG